MKTNRPNDPITPKNLGADKQVFRAPRRSGIAFWCCDRIGDWLIGGGAFDHFQIEGEEGGVSWSSPLVQSGQLIDFYISTHLNDFVPHPLLDSPDWVPGPGSASLRNLVPDSPITDFFL